MERGDVIEVGSKARFRRAVPKSYSYRYEVANASGPDERPLLERGRAIIETRYRGRSATWTVSSIAAIDVKYTVSGTYVAPDPDNLLAYPAPARRTTPPVTTIADLAPPAIAEAVPAAPARSERKVLRATS